MILTNRRASSNKLRIRYRRENRNIRAFKKIDDRRLYGIFRLHVADVRVRLLSAIFGRQMFKRFARTFESDGLPPTRHNIYIYIPNVRPAIDTKITSGIGSRRRVLSPFSLRAVQVGHHNRIRSIPRSCSTANDKFVRVPFCTRLQIVSCYRITVYFVLII